MKHGALDKQIKRRSRAAAKHVRQCSMPLEWTNEEGGNCHNLTQVPCRWMVRRFDSQGMLGFAKIDLTYARAWRVVSRPRGNDTHMVDDWLTSAF